jgi:hypothetical protein
MNFSTEHRQATRELADAAERLRRARPRWFRPLMMALDLGLVAGFGALAWWCARAIG